MALRRHARRRAAALGLATVLGAGCGPPPVPHGPAGPDADSPARTVRLVERWRFDAPAPAGVGMPAGDRHGVAATYGHHRLVLVGPSGEVRWQAERLGLRDVAPALTPTMVVAATDDGVAAFHRATGALRWEVTLGDRASTPVIADGLAVVSTWDGTMAAVRVADGHLVWRITLAGPALGPPDAGLGLAAATWDDTTGAGVHTVDLATRRTRWVAPLHPGGVSAPAVVPSPSGAAVVQVAGDLRVHAHDSVTGQERWSSEIGGAGSPEVPPLATDEGVVVADRLSGLTQFDAEGRRRWTTAGPGAAVRGGPVRLPVGSAGGARRRRLVALPLHEGRLLITDGRRSSVDLRRFPGLVSGASAANGILVVATEEGEVNSLTGYAVAGGRLDRRSPAPGTVGVPAMVAGTKRPARNPRSSPNGTRRAGAGNRWEGAPRGRRHHATTAGGRGSFRSPDPPLEPQDEALHLRRAQRHLHHRSQPDAEAHRGGLHLHA